MQWPLCSHTNGIVSHLLVCQCAMIQLNSGAPRMPSTGQYLLSVNRHTFRRLTLWYPIVGLMTRCLSHAKCMLGTPIMSSIIFHQSMVSTMWSKCGPYNAIDFLDPKNRVIAALDCTITPTVYCYWNTRLCAMIQELQSTFRQSTTFPIHCDTQVGLMTRAFHMPNVCLAPLHVLSMRTIDQQCVGMLATEGGHLTKWEGISSVVPVMAARGTYPLESNSTNMCSNGLTLTDDLYCNLFMIL